MPALARLASRSWSAVLALALSSCAAGCAAGDAADPPAVQQTTAALVRSQSFLVSFTGGELPADADAIVRAAGGAIAARYTAAGAVLARSSAPGFATALRASLGVEGVGAVTAVSSALGPVRARAARRAGTPAAPPAAASGDPLSFRQWDMDQIHAPQARAVASGRRQVLVGVLDSGVDVTHPDLAAQVDAGASVSCVGGVPDPSAAVWSNDVIGHGTHVSGIIAAARNGVGIVGVAPRARLAALKVAVDDVNDPTFGMVFADSMVCAIDWAITHGIDVMNASLTIDPFTAPIDDIFCSDDPDRAAVVRIVRRAVQAAASRKIPLVAAAGNFFSDLRHLESTTGSANCRLIPVQLPRVIGVSAVGVTRRLAFYSDYGLGAIDVTAPGGDGLIPDPNVTDRDSSGQVLSAVPPGSLFYALSADWNGQVQDCTSGTCSTYAYLQGTSQATPHVTGVAALAISRFSRLAPDALLALLSLTARPLACPQGPYDPGMTGAPATCIGPPQYNSFYGAGEVDALPLAR